MQDTDLKIKLEFKEVEFKAAVRSFSSLSPSLFEICNCSYSQNYQLYVDCASALPWKSRVLARAQVEFAQRVTMALSNDAH